MKNNFENVVFDIDNTITKETEFIKLYAPDFLKKKYGIDAVITNDNGANVSEIYGLYDIFKNMEENKDLTDEQLLLKCKKVNSSFNSRNFIKYNFYPLNPDAKKTINDIRKMNKNINFVTLRGIKNNENEKALEIFIRKFIVPGITKVMLRLNGIKYDKLFLVEKAEDKKKIIIDLKATYVFDDSIDVINSLNDVDTTPVCVERLHNVLVNFTNERVVKAPFNYDTIINIVKCSTDNKNLNEKINIVKINKKRKKKIKKLKIYQKFSTECLYKLVRSIGKNKVMADYKPLVIGEENLPKEKGPDIFVGNHRNIKDPLITIAMLKNPTHFAALKRMFEYNENMFGNAVVGKNFGTVATTWFVKLMGAYPVARPDDEDFGMVNIQTFSYFNEYISKNSAVAIYPEGTLNRDPEKDGNVLPLKSNHAFKIGENGKGIIRPVAIVWVPKDVDIEQKVVIAFLKPIYTDGLKAKEISERWRISVNNAINSINRIIEELGKINTEYYELEGTEKVKKLSESIKKI